MLSKVSRPFSTWLHQRLAASAPHKTVALLVDKSELQTLDCLKPYSSSEHFVQDLALDKHHWIYNQNRRILVVQHDSTEKDVAKHMRDLGTMTCASLQAKKTANAEIICSSKIDSKMLGFFFNSFHLTNYEWSKKSFIQDEEEKKQEDERLYRKSKLIDSFEVCHEDDFSIDKNFIKQKVMAQATTFARNLANVRGSTATPCYMEAQVQALCSQHRLWLKEVRVVKGSQLLDEKMGLFHAVGRAATSEPRLVAVHYVGDSTSTETLALVGKGLTFDTGGLNLKPTGYMEDMYGDKNGACAVLGALHGVLSTKPKVNIVFVMGFAENAIDSKSYKPGDIITSRKGLTVEIGNTDAEGRLVLADTFTYIQQSFKPTKLIDLATLTGAVMGALGQETAGLFSNDENLASELLESGNKTFEPLWRLPIFNEHREAMKSQFADLNNMGKTRFGGASQAAAFLERFIEKDTKWAHFDIAGPAIVKAAKGPISADGTGFGTQILLDYIWKQAKFE